MTQLTFSTDGMLLYTGARRDGSIRCWDIRKSCTVLATFARACPTNQKIGFELVGPTSAGLLTASQDGNCSWAPRRGSSKTWLHTCAQQRAACLLPAVLLAVLLACCTSCEQRAACRAACLLLAMLHLLLTVPRTRSIPPQMI